MADELSTQDTDLVNAVSEHGVGDLLKPMIREIELFDSYLAGTSHLEDPSVLTRIKPEDKLILQREDNMFDKKAIMILTENKEKLGYVPEKDNVVFSRLMDAGKLLSARITDIKQKGNYTQIGIKIYLIDF